MIDLVQPLLVVGATGTLIVGAGLDVRSRRIPNVVTFGSAALGFLANLALRHGTGAGVSAEGWAVGVGILLLPFIARGVGGGDVKLLAAVGAWDGPGFVVQCLFWAALAGSALALGLLAARGQLWPTAIALLARVVDVLAVGLILVLPVVMPVVSTLRRRLVVGGAAGELRLAIPFGPALALGGVIAFAVGTRWSGL